jgi:dipeptidyl aminopeptidase/acylaminoacyl peptidase
MLHCGAIPSILHSMSRPASVALLTGTLISALNALGPAHLAGQELPDTPTFQEVLSLESVGGVAISPDGARVAYTVRSTDWEENGYDTEIWLAADGEPFQLTRTADGSSTSPQWSPDGRWLSFLADRGGSTQVHLIDPRGGEAWAVTEVEGGVTSFAWAPTGERILLRVREPETDEDKARSEQYGAYAVEDEEYRNSHLWVLDIDSQGETTEPERLTEGDYHVADAEWSPDAGRLVYVRQPNANLLSFMESDIYVLDLESGESRGLVTGPGPDGGPEWSPDGEWIVFSEFDRDLESLFYLNGELARIPAAGGKIEILTTAFDEDLGGAVWTEAGIRFAASERTERKLYTLDPDTRMIEALTLPTPIVGSWDFTPDGRTLAFTGQSAASLSEVYRAWGGMATGGAEASGRPEHVKLTDMTSQTSDWPLGTREVVTWTSEDGAEIEGVLFKPTDYDPGTRYPLLVQIHGGPTGTSRPTAVATYVYPIIHWLQKGAVVLQPNYRGSAGYGEAFRSLNVRNLGVGDMWDVMSGVQHLIDQGIVDPDRLGAMGWSQGGYISAFLTTNTDRFKAISVGAGISNWMTYYVNTDIHPFTRQYLKGTPWDDPEVYAKTSPMTNITKATTPTLIQHGEFDRRVPIPNAYELYQGLQDQEVETRLIVYKGFGHGINKPKELLAGVWHNWQWFAKYIWGEDIEIPLEVEEENAEKVTAAAEAGEGKP